MSKIKPNELFVKKRKLKDFLDRERKYDFDLIYAVNQNIVEIDNKIDILRDSLPDDVEEFENFQREKIEIIQECGGRVQQTSEGNIELVNPEEVDIEEYNKKIEELQAQYKDVLDKQQEINKERQEVLQSKEIEIDWIPLKREYFPEDITPNELPVELQDLIEK